MQKHLFGCLSGVNKSAKGSLGSIRTLARFLNFDASDSNTTVYHLYLSWCLLSLFPKVIAWNSSKCCTDSGVQQNLLGCRSDPIVIQIVCLGFKNHPGTITIDSRIKAASISLFIRKCIVYGSIDQ